MFKFNCYFIFVCVLIGIIACACTTQKIEFKRDSVFTRTMKQALPQKSTIKKNKNIYIYKYGDNKEIDDTNVNFGPKDLDFDLPAKFR